MHLYLNVHFYFAKIESVGSTQMSKFLILKSCYYQTIWSLRQVIVLFFRSVFVKVPSGAKYKMEAGLLRSNDKVTNHKTNHIFIV